MNPKHHTGRSAILSGLIVRIWPIARYTGDMTNSSNPTNPTKNALVLGGGGSRGSYTIGVLATLLEQKQHYDLVTGISIGALVGGILAMDQPVNYEKFIASFTDNSVATGLFEFPHRNEVLKTRPASFNEFVASFQQGGPSVQPLRTNYEKIFDFEAFKNSKIDYLCLAADLSDNRPAVFMKKDMETEADAVNAMLASAAYFPAFSFVNIQGKYYADGGYLNTTLGREAVDLGYDSLTVVALKDPGESVSYCEAQTRLLIRPILKLAYYLDFSKDQLVNQIEQGRLEALKFMNLAPGYVYTFYAEDAFLFRTLSKTAVTVLEKNNIHFTSEMLVGGISELLGYRPGELNNSYMKDYQVGLLLECLGLIAGLSPYQHYHLLPFVKELLHRLQSFEIHITPSETGDTIKMDRYGACDMMAFFYNGLKIYDGKLPAEFDLAKKK